MVSQLDRNRLKQVYPLHRREPRTLDLTISAIAEIGEVTFNGTETENHVFSTNFSSAPYVTTTPSDLFINDGAGVAVMIDSVSTTNMVLSASAVFSGSVHFHAIELI